MIDEEEIAGIVRLFARAGDSQAIDILISDALEVIDKGRRDLATHLLDMSKQFHRLWLEGRDRIGDEADGLRVISFSLRIAAHRLHLICGDIADDPRLLRLIVSNEEKI
jgi:hypothetical protein